MAKTLNTFKVLTRPFLCRGAGNKREWCFSGGKGTEDGRVPKFWVPKIWHRKWRARKYSWNPERCRRFRKGVQMVQTVRLKIRLTRCGEKRQKVLSEVRRGDCAGPRANIIIGDCCRLNKGKFSPTARETWGERQKNERAKKLIARARTDTSLDERSRKTQDRSWRAGQWVESAEVARGATEVEATWTSTCPWEQYQACNTKQDVTPFPQWQSRLRECRPLA